MAENQNEDVVRSDKDKDPRSKGWVNLRPFRKGDGRAALAGHKGGKSKAQSKIISSALLAKLVRQRAKSVAEALIRQAENGSVFAFNSLADRVEGKVAERIEVTGNVDLGVRIAAARARRRLETNVDAGPVTVEAQVVSQVSEPESTEIIDIDHVFGSHSS